IGSFIADAGFNGGATFSGSATIDLSACGSLCAPAGVYQNDRYATSFNYIITGLAAGATYRVILHFTEDYSGNNFAGRRYVNVNINGTQVLTNFDIFATAGALNKAIVQSFSAAADSSGKMTITFNGGSGTQDPNAKIDGLQVLAPIVASGN